MTGRFFHGANAALFTDLYQLTMAQAYLEAGHAGPACFDLFARELPPERGFLVACGQIEALEYLEQLRFSGEDIDYLRSLGKFSDTLLDWLREFRFSGRVRAVPEGRIVFAEEPILSVEAPAPEAQIVETWLLNQVHMQTVLASKAVRVVRAAGESPVLDFGLRRIPGADAGLKAARAYHVAGVAATSNVLAGRVYGVPVAGTMAHSFIQSFDDEREAFRAFADSFPDTILLVDTYDTLRGVDRVVELSRDLGEAFRVSGIRLDSGDLGELARESRRRLNAAGLQSVRIYASGGLDEYSIAELVRAGAPIDGYGVGTAMGVSDDAPFLDVAYKLSAYGGKPRMKLSTGKRSLPGAKQVFRETEGGRLKRDVIAGADEDLAGEPLLKTVMEDGRGLAEPDLDAARERCRRDWDALPEGLQALKAPQRGYPVALSEALSQRMETLRRELES